MPSKDSSGKQTRRRLYWKVTQCARSVEVNQDSTKTRSASTSSQQQEEHIDRAGSSASSSFEASPSTTQPRSSEKEEESMDNAFFIEYTPNKEEASNFYLKPIIRSLSKGDKYFHIVTDPEDY